ncbi:hypothetical protein [Bradyrhizobium sp. CB3481]|uniref:hypothetical protein n=1 Tax=Bradyrhizobium sp. CB3481 TaxID=3039158 RepID=UPI0024B04653|nr:hypothetical protein [Bradyrhizobium sp. CB3481]WFU18831.1 hypothetical protein QA643_11080 [Bradyrhizobium sp. CB3481]
MPSIAYRLTSLFRRFSDRALGIRDIRKQLYELRWHIGQATLKDILSQTRYQEPKRLLRHGYKVFSQEDEDGIIAEIFNRIGTETKQFVEIGVENGWECNTCTLLYHGWKGVWFEGSSSAVASIKDKFSDRISNGQLEANQKFVTRDFSAELSARWPSLKGLDLFSIDIDGNDYDIIEALQGKLQARLIIVEYNPKLRPPIDWHMPYRADHVWDGTDWYSASLTAWTRLLSDKGYSLVGCNITGNNAFFVRSDLASGKLLSFEAQRESPYRGGRSPHWIKIKNRLHHSVERVKEASR